MHLKVAVTAAAAMVVVAAEVWERLEAKEANVAGVSRASLQRAVLLRQAAGARACRVRASARLLQPALASMPILE